MEHTGNTSQTNGTLYVIRIQEKLEQGWEEWFNGMTMVIDEAGTQLSGLLPDQSALHGVIATIHRLGLRLVSVSQGNDEQAQG